MLTKVEFTFPACEQVSLAVQGKKHYFESFCRHLHQDEKDNGFPFWKCYIANRSLTWKQPFVTPTAGCTAFFSHMSWLSIKSSKCLRADPQTNENPGRLARDLHLLELSSSCCSF